MVTLREVLFGVWGPAGEGRRWGLAGGLGGCLRKGLKHQKDSKDDLNTWFLLCFADVSFGKYLWP